MPRSGYDITGFSSWVLSSSQQHETNTRTIKRIGGGAGAGVNGGAREDGNNGKNPPPGRQRTTVPVKPQVKQSKENRILGSVGGSLRDGEGGPGSIPTIISSRFGQVEKKELRGPRFNSRLI
ncbi:hypothetical protein VTI28DRAFT_8630 [Corynascus sepedonium]